jgi:hypothetical protein
MPAIWRPSLNKRKYVWVAAAAVAFAALVAASQIFLQAWEEGAKKAQKSARLDRLCRWAIIDIRRPVAGALGVQLPRDFEVDPVVLKRLEFIEREGVQAGRAQYRIEVVPDKLQSALEPHHDAAQIVVTEASARQVVAVLGYVAENAGGGRPPRERFFCPRGFTLEEYRHELVPYVLGALEGERKAAVARKIADSGALVAR